MITTTTEQQHTRLLNDMFYTNRRTNRLQYCTIQYNYSFISLVRLKLKASNTVDIHNLIVWFVSIQSTDSTVNRLKWTSRTDAAHTALLL